MMEEKYNRLTMEEKYNRLTMEEKKLTVEEKKSATENKSVTSVSCEKLCVNLFLTSLGLGVFILITLYMRSISNASYEISIITFAAVLFNFAAITSAILYTDYKDKHPQGEVENMIIAQMALFEVCSLAITFSIFGQYGYDFLDTEDFTVVLYVWLLVVMHAIPVAIVISIFVGIYKCICSSRSNQSTTEGYIQDSGFVGTFQSLRPL